MENAPLLMQFQDYPFNGDGYAENEFLKLKDKFLLSTAVETGSCFYTTTTWLADNFEKVYTVEINPEYAKYGTDKISQKRNVFKYIDDSVLFINKLNDLISPSERVIFFLDAHWGNHCPLLEELDGIVRLKVDMPPIIVIHDFYTGNPELGYDTYNGQPFTYEWIEGHINAIAKSHNCEYEYYYNENATGAKRGIVYITPKLKL